MIFATLQDLKDRFGRAWNPSLDVPAQTLLDDISAVIRQKIPTIEARVMSGIVLPEVLKLVVCTAVLRVLKNPDGYRTTTEGQVSYTMDGRVSTGYLDLLDSEWQLLGYSKNRAFSIDVGHGEHGHICNINTTCGFQRVFATEGNVYIPLTETEHAFEGTDD